MVPDLTQLKISLSRTPIRAEPSRSSESTSEALFCESLQVLEQQPDWLRVKQLRDGYEGFVEISATTECHCVATHWLVSRASLVFESDDIKSPIKHRLLFGSELCIDSSQSSSEFSKLQTGGYVWADHIKPIGERLKDSMISIAESHYLNAPYRWGGRSSDGCDCSGLVQMLAFAKGVMLPRDSGDQESALDIDIEYDDRNKEDLVYWPGHVGILKNRELLLHANAHSLDCRVEPLSDVIDRAGQPTSIKRLSFQA